VSHLLFLAIPLAWWWRSRRFPVGRLDHNQLRPWYVLWALAVVGEFAVAFIAPPSRIHLPAPSVFVAQLVFLAFLVGTAEEFLFRGLIQTAINASLGGSVWLGTWQFRFGTALAALLFGLWHLVNLSYQSAAVTGQQVLTAAVVGWIIGVVYDRTRNLIGACVLHNLLDFLGAVFPVLAYLAAHGGR
jgi:membrane protease YdiL (CAAX protease family)